jgi:hypothetical protein
LKNTNILLLVIFLAILHFHLETSFSTTSNGLASNLTEQNAIPRQDIDYTTIFTSLGAGIIGALGSLLGVIITNRHNNEKEKKLRNVSTIQDKVNIYSFLIFGTSKILSTPNLKEVKEISNDIDNTIKNKFYLLYPSTIPFWITINRIISLYSSNGDNKMPFDAFANFFLLLFEYWEYLVAKYNNKIIPLYEKGIGELKDNEKNKFEVVSKISINEFEISLEILTSKDQELKQIDSPQSNMVTIKIQVKPKNEIKSLEAFFLSYVIYDSSNNIIKTRSEQSKIETFNLTEELNPGNFTISGKIGCAYYEVRRFTKEISIPK